MNKVLQLDWYLIIGQFRIKSTKKLVKIGPVALGGGEGEAVEWLVQAGERRRSVAALVTHLTHGVQGRQVNGNAEKRKSLNIWFAYAVLFHYS